MKSKRTSSFGVLFLCKNVGIGGRYQAGIADEWGWFKVVDPFVVKLRENLSDYAIIFLLPPLDWYGKGVNYVELFISFVISVAASIVAYYVCKWLDSDSR